MLEPPGEGTLLFHISNPHSASNTYCLPYKMIVMVKMNMMTARLMAGRAEVMSMRMMSLSQVERSTVSCRPHEEHSGGLGQHQRDVWDHIKWNECDWATGLSSTHKPPTVSGLHHEGQRGGIQKNCLQFTGWCLEAGVYLDLCIYDEEREFMWSENRSRHTSGSLKRKSRKHQLYKLGLPAFCHRQRTARAQAFTASLLLMSVVQPYNNKSTLMDVAVSPCYFGFDSLFSNSCPVDGTPF